MYKRDWKAMLKMFRVVTSEGNHICVLAYSPWLAKFLQWINITLELSLVLNVAFTIHDKKKKERNSPKTHQWGYMQIEYSTAALCQCGKIAYCCVEKSKLQNYTHKGPERPWTAVVSSTDYGASPPTFTTCLPLRSYTTSGRSLSVPEPQLSPHL